jgi:hypothetical protein
MTVERVVLDTNVLISTVSLPFQRIAILTPAGFLAALSRRIDPPD